MHDKLAWSKLNLTWEVQNSFQRNLDALQVATYTKCPKNPKPTIQKYTYDIGRPC